MKFVSVIHNLIIIKLPFYKFMMSNCYVNMSKMMKNPHLVKKLLMNDTIPSLIIRMMIGKGITLSVTVPNNDDNDARW